MIEVREFDLNNDGTVRVWNRRSGEERATLTGHTGGVQAVVVTPDGEEVVSGSVDGTVRVWNRRSGEERATLTGHTGGVRAVAVTPDGEEVVSGSVDGTVRVWNRRSGEERATLTGHTGWVRAVAVTPDGEEVVSGSVDGTVRVWNRRSGEERATLTGHTGWVRAVAVTPDGEEVVTAGNDGTVRVWNRASARQVRGTDLGGVGVVRPLPGFRSDEPSTEDLLGIAAEVETMAALVAAVSTEAPLAIGLLGDWGSGKSSFMRQMELHVAELAALSANNLARPSSWRTLARFGSTHGTTATGTSGQDWSSTFSGPWSLLGATSLRPSPIRRGAPRWSGSSVMPRASTPRPARVGESR